MDEHQPIARIDNPFLKNAVVPSCPPRPLNAVGHVRATKPLVQLPAQLPSLTDLDLRRSDLEDVPDRDVLLAIRQTRLIEDAGCSSAMSSDEVDGDRPCARRAGARRSGQSNSQASPPDLGHMENAAVAA